MKNPNNLLEDVKKCMTDPISSILLNFSIEKSRKGYNERVKQWGNGGLRQNPVAKMEEVSLVFANLSELSIKSIEAHNLCVNLKKEDFNKGVDWYIYGQNIVVSRYRLKTFEEWLHDGLKDAITLAIKEPEGGARKVIEKELGEGIYTNAFIHMYAEGKIDNETLKRLGQYEKHQAIEGRDIEEDIKEAMRALLGMEEDNKKDTVTVLTLKM